MKIKFNSDNKLPLNKILKLYVFRSAFKVENKCCPQVFLNECVYEL